MKDPILSIAGDQLWLLAQDVRLQLEKGATMRPVLWLLADAKSRAAEAMHDLAKVDPTDSNSIRTLQNEVSLYSDMIDAVKRLLSRAKEEDREIAETDRHELTEILTPEDAQALGITLQTED